MKLENFIQTLKENDQIKSLMANLENIVKKSSQNLLFPFSPKQQKEEWTKINTTFDEQQTFSNFRPHMSGVYLIINLEKEKTYVGQNEYLSE